MIKYIPIAITAVGLNPFVEVIKTSASITSVLFNATRGHHKTVSGFLFKTDLLHKFEMIKAFESEINNERSKGLRDILIEIENILGIIKRDLELNTKILIPFYKFDIEKHLPRLEELNQLLDIRFNLLCSILQTLN